MITAYRTGNRNARNIYQYNFDKDEETHVGVMFTPEDGRAAVDALNLWATTMNKATRIHQYMVRAVLPNQNGNVTTDTPYRTFFVFAPSEEEAARVFHAGNPLAVIRDLWQLIPPGYLDGNALAPNGHDRDLCATPVKANARTANEEVDW